MGSNEISCFEKGYSFELQCFLSFSFFFLLMKANEILNNFVESDFCLLLPFSKSDIKKLVLEMFFNQTGNNSFHISSNITGTDVDIEIKYSNLDYRLEKQT